MALPDDLPGSFSNVLQLCELATGPIAKGDVAGLRSHSSISTIRHIGEPNPGHDYAPRSVPWRRLIRRLCVPVIDTYYALKGGPLHETYIYSDWWPNHSKTGNEVVSDLIADEIAQLAP